MPDTDQTPTPADLDSFDVDAFIAGITRPYQVVPIVQDGRLGQQLHEASRAVADLEEAEAVAKAEGRPTQRRAATTESPELEDARAHLEALRARAEGKYVFVEVESTDKLSRRQALKDAQAAGGDVDMYNVSLISLTARLHRVDPRDENGDLRPDAVGRVLTREQWEALSGKVGALQWDKIIDASSRVAEGSVTPDFSRPASPSRNGDDSSKS